MTFHCTHEMILIILLACAAGGAVGYTIALMKD